VKVEAVKVEPAKVEKVEKVENGETAPKAATPAPAAPKLPEVFRPAPAPKKDTAKKADTANKNPIKKPTS
jgi:hypothetical protein